MISCTTLLHPSDAQLLHVANLLPQVRRAQALGHMRWCARTPYATLQLIEVDHQLVGYCTALRFGTTGRIAHVFADPGLQEDDFRTALAEGISGMLEFLGAPSVHVQCAPEEVPFWEQLGFSAHDRFVRYGGGEFVEAQRDEVLLMEPVHTLALLHLDRKATGEERTPLLMEHRYAAQGYVEDNRLRGALLPALGHGYIVADAPEVGLELQRWLLPVQQHIIVPEANQAACAHLHERGYRVQATSVRLVRGALPHFRPELVFAWPW